MRFPLTAATLIVGSTDLLIGTVPSFNTDFFTVIALFRKEDLGSAAYREVCHVWDG